MQKADKSEPKQQKALLKSTVGEKILRNIFVFVHFLQQQASLLKALDTGIEWQKQ